MDLQFVQASSFMLIVNLIYSLLGFTLAVCAIAIVDKLFLRKLCLQEEIRKGNLAAAIFASALVLAAVFAVSKALGK
jgi:hypothetical protein